MSVESHPNLHAVNLVVKIVAAYIDSLRGAVDKSNMPDITDLIVAFVEAVEERVDMVAEAM